MICEILIHVVKKQNLVKLSKNTGKNLLLSRKLVIEALFQYHQNIDLSNILNASDFIMKLVSLLPYFTFFINLPKIISFMTSIKKDFSIIKRL
jgi:hypothetical protein